MEIRELSSLGMNININTIEVDATEVIERTFFNLSHSKNYRNDSVDYMTKNKINWHSTCNSDFDVMKRFIKIQCPTCNRNMEPGSASGSGSHATTYYKCTHCMTKVSLTVVTDGFSVNFEDNKEFEQKKKELSNKRIKRIVEKEEGKKN